MKAVFINKQGGPEVLEYGEMPDPIAASNEVIVDIHAASVNGADWKVRTGTHGSVPEYPYILGRDFSGVIKFAGSEVNDLIVGEEVFGVCATGQEGAYAEKIAVNAEIIARKPEDISHTVMSALSLAGLTALVAIEDTIMLQTGEKILIQGGAGGVASFAIQLAKHCGAHVITTASLSNHDFVRSLGADEVIDYNKQDFTEQVSDCDAVLETVGGEVAERSFSVLRPGGRAAFIASGVTAPKAPSEQVLSLRPNVERDRAHLNRIVDLVKADIIRPPEITVFPLSNAVDAHVISEARHLRGKMVLNVR